jgi:ethanolamine ammonia-lyase small subunit
MFAKKRLTNSGVSHARRVFGLLKLRDLNGFNVNVGTYVGGMEKHRAVISNVNQETLSYLKAGFLLLY